MPLYLVVDSQVDPESSGAARLVNASKPATAIRHVVNSRFKVSTPDGLELHRLGKAGVDIEIAGAAEAEEEAEPETQIVAPMISDVTGSVDFTRAAQSEPADPDPDGDRVRAMRPRQSIIDQIEQDDGNDRLSDTDFYGSGAAAG